MTSRKTDSHCNKFLLYMYDLSDPLYPSSYLNGLLYRKREVTSGQILEWRIPSQGSSTKSVGIEKLFRLKAMKQ